MILIYHAKTNQKKDGIIILIPNKIDNKVIRDKEGYYMMIKRINSARRLKNPNCAFI